jgi:signal transduction histidine kinase
MKKIHTIALCVVVLFSLLSYYWLNSRDFGESILPYASYIYLDDTPELHGKTYSEFKDIPFTLHGDEGPIEIDGNNQTLIKIDVRGIKHPIKNQLYLFIPFRPFDSIKIIYKTKKGNVKSRTLGTYPFNFQESLIPVQIGVKLQNLDRSEPLLLLYRQSDYIASHAFSASIASEREFLRKTYVSTIFVSFSYAFFAFALFLSLILFTTNREILFLLYAFKLVFDVLVISMADGFFFMKIGEGDFFQNHLPQASSLLRTFSMAIFYMFFIGVIRKSHYAFVTGLFLLFFLMSVSGGLFGLVEVVYGAVQNVIVAAYILFYLIKGRARARQASFVYIPYLTLVCMYSYTFILGNYTPITEPYVLWLLHMAGIWEVVALTLILVYRYINSRQKIDRDRLELIHVTSEKSKLEQANYSQIKYVTTLVHDVQQLLVGSDMIVSSLEADSKGQARKVTKLKHAITSAQKLITSSLKNRRVELGFDPPEIEQINLYDVAEDSISMFEHASESHQFSLKVGKEICVESNFYLLQKILINIISNSLKHNKNVNIYIEDFQIGGRPGVHIWDDGTGFDVDRYAKEIDEGSVQLSFNETSNGIFIIVNLSHILGIEMNLSSSKGGTHYHFYF